jgi:hypothetical protein
LTLEAKGKDMATILAFRRDPGRLPTILPPGHSAQLFFFTGVRYERGEAALHQGVHHSTGTKSSKPRLAQPTL